MARRRHTSDIMRMLLRNLARRSTHDVSTIAAQLREYAVMRRFLDGRSIDEVHGYQIGGAWDRARVEQAIRNVHRRGWR